MHPSPSESRLSSLPLTAATAIIGGAIIGASTNAINGIISPTYFRNIMRWDHVEHLWRAIIAQGVFEGLIYGVLFAVVFTGVVGIVSRAQSPFALIFQSLIGIFAAVYCCWVVGGILAMALATLSSEFYRSSFIGVPEKFVPMLRYAWVGGSIWGAMFGGLLSLVIGSILFNTKWRRFTDADSHSEKAGPLTE